MARGDGITRIHGAKNITELPEGREPGDARGATWPLLLLTAGLILGPCIAVLINGSLALYREDRPIGPWINEIKEPLAALIGAVFAALLTKVLNNAGRSLRNQQALAANQQLVVEKQDEVKAKQDAVERLTKATADGLIALGRQVEHLTQRLNDRDDEQLRADLAAATQALRDLSDETGARLGRVVAAITGSQRAVPPAAPQPGRLGQLDREAPPPASRASDPARQDPFDTSRPWYRDTGVLPTQPPADQ